MVDKKKPTKKTKLKQSQKQSQKQTVVVNLEAPKKKKTSKKKTPKNNQQQQPAVRETGQQGYYRHINTVPNVVQQIPTNNELVEAIKGVLNPTSQPVPTQVNPELLPKTINEINALYRNLETTNEKIRKTFYTEKKEAGTSPASTRAPSRDTTISAPDSNSFQSALSQASSRNTSIYAPDSISFQSAFSQAPSRASSRASSRKVKSEAGASSSDREAGVSPAKSRASSDIEWKVSKYVSPAKETKGQLEFKGNVKVKNPNTERQINFPTNYSEEQLRGEKLKGSRGRGRPKKEKEKEK